MNGLHGRNGVRLRASIKNICKPFPLPPLVECGPGLGPGPGPGPVVFTKYRDRDRGKKGKSERLQGSSALSLRSWSSPAAALHRQSSAEPEQPQSQASHDREMMIQQLFPFSLFTSTFSIQPTIFYVI